MDRKKGLYFIKCNSAGGLTHAGTGKKGVDAFDNRNIWKRIKGELVK